MNKEIIKEIIEDTAKVTTDMLIIRLKKEKLLKSGRTPYQKVETLLYNYNKFKDIISDKEKEIEIIREHGTFKRSNSITFFSKNVSNEQKSEMEQIESAINKLNEDITITKYAISKINSALEQIKDDKYYKIIEFRYLMGKTIENIAELLDKDITTIYRNKTRLINALKIHLFTDETILELMN